jgi:pimeloyl-ACP methyl ester carboxylesterase
MAVAPVSFVSPGGHPLCGILHAAGSEPSPTAIVILSPGIKNRVAPHRLYVKMARRFESLGYDVLRFDPEGLGDSGGEIAFETAADLYGSIQRGRFAADTRAALDWMRAARGTQRFVLSGLCGGAITGLHAGQDDNRVVGLLGLGIPVILDGTDVDKRRHVTDGQLAGLRKGYLKRVFRLESLMRLLTFRSDIRLIWKSLMQPLKASKRTEAPDAEQGSNVNPTFAPAYDRFLTGGRKVLLVFSESDRLYWEYKEKFEAHNRSLVDRHAAASRIHVTPDANHIFSFHEWQEDMLHAAVSWLNENFPLN